MSEKVKQPAPTVEPEKRNDNDDLLVSVTAIKQARDRDARATDDGGSSGRSDTNDNAIF